MIDPELDDRLERGAARRGMSKSALVRECVARYLGGEPGDNGLLALLELSKLNADVDPVDDIDELLYGPLEADS